MRPEQAVWTRIAEAALNGRRRPFLSSRIILPTFATQQGLSEFDTMEGLVPSIVRNTRMEHIAACPPTSS